MYAIKGQSARAICDGMELLPGETMMEVIPPEIVAATRLIPPVTTQQLVDETKRMISDWLDRVVHARGYDDIVSCISYVGDPSERFDAEARAARSWRSAVYTAGYEILANVPAGLTRPEQVLELLPTPGEFGWPE
ncbi:TPA: hypothetical protein QDZ75_003641 [Stenotrophomonas maltophilia]|nr:hypothetical protein [Stenotrophomonas maltophilia]